MGYHGLQPLPTGPSHPSVVVMEILAPGLRQGPRCPPNVAGPCWGQFGGIGLVVQDTSSSTAAGTCLDCRGTRAGRECGSSVGPRPPACYVASENQEQQHKVAGDQVLREEAPCAPVLPTLPHHHLPILPTPPLPHQLCPPVGPQPMRAHRVQAAPRGGLWCAQRGGGLQDGEPADSGGETEAGGAGGGTVCPARVQKQEQHLLVQRRGVCRTCSGQDRGSEEVG